MFQNRATWMLLILVWFTTGAIDVESLAQQDKPRPTSPTAQMQSILRQLRSEAAAVQKGQQQMREEANFARDSEIVPPKEMIGQNIARTHHRDPFIDAYIRWQLTSFDPSLPALPQRQQQAMLGNLPSLEKNPLSDQVVLNRINQLLRIPILTEQEQSQIVKEYTQLAESKRAAQKRNVPATQLRLWLIKNYPPATREGIECRAEFLAALVSSGWEARGAKNLLQASCEVAGENKEMTDAERASIQKLLMRLIGLESTAVQNLSVGDFTLQADFRSSTIHDYEVRQWTRALYNESDQSVSPPAMQP